MGEARRNLAKSAPANKSSVFGCNNTTSDLSASNSKRQQIFGPFLIVILLLKTRLITDGNRFFLNKRQESFCLNCQRHKFLIV